MDVAVEEGEIGGYELLFVHHHRQAHHDGVCNINEHLMINNVVKPVTV